MGGEAVTMSRTGDRQWLLPRVARSLGLCLLVVVLTVATARMMASWLSHTDVVMIFIVPVLWSAVRLGRWPSLFTAVMGALASNYFFFPPEFAFGFLSFQDLVALTMYLLTALTAGSLAARAREQADLYQRQVVIARRREEESATLYRLGRGLTAAAGPEELCRTAVAAVADFTGTAVALLEQGPEGWRLLAGEGDISVDGDIARAADTAAGLRRPAGNGTDLLPATGSLVIPLPIQGGAPLALAVVAGGMPIEADRLRILVTLADQTGMALSGAHMSDQVAEARVRLQADQFRSALLNSVSHDFRTPLGTILGAATSLLEDPEAHTEASRHTLLTAIREAADRLNRYVRNLLDITRIESGVLQPQSEWVDAADLIGTAVRRIESLASGRLIEVKAAPDLPLLHVDFVLIEQVLVNLLENAIKFSGPGHGIEVTARRHGQRLLIEVFNAGSDLPEGDPERLFDKFGQASDAPPARRRGSGLGLAICRGFMMAHGGSISVRRVPERGGVAFSLFFPLADQPEDMDRHGEE